MWTRMNYLQGAHSTTSLFWGVQAALKSDRSSLKMLLLWQTCTYDE